MTPLHPMYGEGLLGSQRADRSFSPPSRSGAPSWGAARVRANYPDRAPTAGIVLAVAYCVHCGSNLTPGARSCERCGSPPALADLPGRNQTCPACRAFVAASWRHCVSCGTVKEQPDLPRLVRTSIAAEASAYVRNRPAPDTKARADRATVTADDHWPAELHP